MPANAFPFAVFVGGKDEFVGLFDGILQLFDGFLFVFGNDVQWLEVTFYVHAQLRPFLAFVLAGDFLGRLG